MTVSGDVYNKTVTQDFISDLLNTKVVSLLGKENVFYFVVNTTETTVIKTQVLLLLYRNKHPSVLYFDTPIDILLHTKHFPATAVLRSSAFSYLLLQLLMCY